MKIEPIVIFWVIVAFTLLNWATACLLPLYIQSVDNVGTLPQWASSMIATCTTLYQVGLGSILTMIAGPLITESRSGQRRGVSRDPAQ